MVFVCLGAIRGSARRAIGGIAGGIELIGLVRVGVIANNIVLPAKAIGGHGSTGTGTGIVRGLRGRLSGRRGDAGIFIPGIIRSLRQGGSRPGNRR